MNILERLQDRTYGTHPSIYLRGYIIPVQSCREEEGLLLVIDTDGKTWYVDPQMVHLIAPDDEGARNALSKAPLTLEEFYESQSPSSNEEGMAALLEQIRLPEPCPPEQILSELSLTFSGRAEDLPIQELAQKVKSHLEEEERRKLTQELESCLTAYPKEEKRIYTLCAVNAFLSGNLEAAARAYVKAGQLLSALCLYEAMGREDLLRRYGGKYLLLASSKETLADQRAILRYAFLCQGKEDVSAFVKAGFFLQSGLTHATRAAIAALIKRQDPGARPCASDTDEELLCDLMEAWAITPEEITQEAEVWEEELLWEEHPSDVQAPSVKDPLQERLQNEGQGRDQFEEGQGRERFEEGQGRERFEEGQKRDLPKEGQLGQQLLVYEWIERDTLYSLPVKLRQPFQKHPSFSVNGQKYEYFYLKNPSPVLKNGDDVYLHPTLILDPTLGKYLQLCTDQDIQGLEVIFTLSNNGRGEVAAYAFLPRMYQKAVLKTIRSSTSWQNTPFFVKESIPEVMNAQAVRSLNKNTWRLPSVSDPNEELDTLEQFLFWRYCLCQDISRPKIPNAFTKDRLLSMAVHFFLETNDQEKYFWYGVVLCRLEELEKTEDLELWEYFLSGLLPENPYSYLHTQAENKSAENILQDINAMILEHPNPFFLTKLTGYWQKAILKARRRASKQALPEVHRQRWDQLELMSQYLLSSIGEELPEEKQLLLEPFFNKKPDAAQSLKQFLSTIRQKVKAYQSSLSNT